MQTEDEVEMFVKLIHAPLIIFCRIHAKNPLVCPEEEAQIEAEHTTGLSQHKVSFNKPPLSFFPIVLLIV